MMLLVIFIVMLSFFSVDVYAKEIDIEMLSERDGAYFLDVLRTEDDELIAVGSYALNVSSGLTTAGGLITKYDSNGNWVWDIQIDTGFTFYTDVKQISNDEYVTIGSKADPSFASIIKFDDDGNVIFEKEMVDENYNYSLFNGFTVDKNDYIAVGYKEDTFDEYNKVNNAYVVKFDNDGNIVWELLNKFGDRASSFNDIFVKSNGSYLSVGKFEKNGNNCGIAVSYEKDGNELHKYEVCNENEDVEFKFVFDNRNNEYVVVSIEGNNTFLYFFDNDNKLIKKEGLSDLGITDILKYKNGYVASAYKTFVDDTDKSRVINYLIHFDKNLEFEDYEIFVEDGLELITSINLLDSGVLATKMSAHDGISVLLSVKDVSTEILEYTIDYTINEEQVSNGNYEIIQNEEVGVIKVKPEEGYVLSAIKIYDSNNNEVPYYENDGEYYFELIDKISVNVEYEKVILDNKVDGNDKVDIVNPDTSKTFSIWLFVICFISFIASIYFFNKKVKLR